MKIYSMTATFGKLEHETLTLQPGLNVISAGNEWGKSTWCAFLSAMLYGLDTRAKSTKNALADKERFAPWSGVPMAGRIDLNWNGKDITIERSTKGRIPMGEFLAYETRSGLNVPELDAQNCGEKLLGVERSVFLRSGFIRLSDLNVTDDEALRRRLNNLVTTGDESSAADGLASQLRDLKNRVRHNRTGLLPQAEAERVRIEEDLQEIRRLEERNDGILRQMDELDDWRLALENHQSALAHKASLEDARKVKLAERAWNEAVERYEDLQVLCNALESRETAQEHLELLRSLADRQMELQKQLQELPQSREAEEEHVDSTIMSPEEVRAKAEADAARYHRLVHHVDYWGIMGLVLGLCGLVWLIRDLVPGLVCCFLGVGAVVRGLVLKMRQANEMLVLEEYYESDDVDLWLQQAEARAEELELERKKARQLTDTRLDLESQLQELKVQIREVTDHQGLELSRRDWEGVLSTWDARDEALRIMRKSEDHYQDLRDMARYAKAPEFHDRLTHSEAYTARLLEECMADRQRLENLQGQCRGNMEALGSKLELEEQLEKVKARIRQLEKTYAALTLAQDTLSQATAELQRRFAPRIAQRAGELMNRMTGGRYDRLSIGDDLSLRAGAQQEDTLRDALWRSDGTVDQLYLSLRLAVAEELLPGVPLVLDDALVRFDDKRAAAAMEILKDEAKDRQVILFTCHQRESQML
ncbi:MAG: hypothetical protein E7465_00305 [Ruminococcaceae bacterium]|nr:hypothetical protein [Oscillospiraceae bacterium]